MLWAEQIRSVYCKIDVEIAGWEAFSQGLERLIVRRRRFEKLVEGVVGFDPSKTGCHQPREEQKDDEGSTWPTCRDLTHYEEGFSAPAKVRPRSIFVFVTHHIRILGIINRFLLLQQQRLGRDWFWARPIEPSALLSHPASAEPDFPNHGD
ncbi:hypothetical protein [Methyloceanibacter sp.]|uniref:hypothetical protein n=1 Tax=Methyloceanibacter sp. TaxID=1965321 RepID=UPI003C773293